MKKIIFTEQLNDNYISRDLLKYGLAKKVIYGLKFGRYFTEEELQENARQAKALTREQWAQRCDDLTIKIADTLYPIIEMLDKKFLIGQYRNDGGKSLSDWDMWFWCNCEGLNGSKCTHEVNGKKCDLSYFTLSFENKEIAENVLKCLEQYEFNDDMQGVKCTVVYNVEAERERIDKVCQAFAENEIVSPAFQNNATGKFYKCGFDFVRLYKCNNGYAFKRKRERVYYELHSDRILMILLDNGLMEKYLTVA